MNINSEHIRVFPTSKRDDRYDRNARFTSEQNLVSIVNRLTSLKSFVISGLTVEKKDSVWLLQEGTANIYGYYFDIIEPVDITSISKGSKYLYLRINVKSQSMTNSSLSFRELQGIDDRNNPALPMYKGLEILVSDTLPVEESINETTGDVYYTLLLATWNDNAWVSEENSLLKYKVSDVKVSFNNDKYPQSFSLTGSLEDWLLNNYVVDDGELT